MLTVPILQMKKVRLRKDKGRMSAKNRVGDFPGGPVVQNLPCNAGDVGSILGREQEKERERERARNSRI